MHDGKPVRNFLQALLQDPLPPVQVLFPTLDVRLGLHSFYMNFMLQGLPLTSKFLFEVSALGLHIFVEVGDFVGQPGHLLIRTRVDPGGLGVHAPFDLVGDSLINPWPEALVREKCVGYLVQFVEDFALHVKKVPDTRNHVRGRLCIVGKLA